MKKLVNSWSFLKHFVFCFLITLLISFIGKFFSHSEASSIGIIGGADGPTSIYVAGKIPCKLIYILGFIWSNMSFYIIIFAIMLIFYKPVKNLITFWKK